MRHDADGVGCSSSSSSSTKRWEYHVFLSFRGETRTNFTDHLYAALGHKGLKTFRDEEELERGQSINQSLPQAIEKSLSAIVVLSPGYASSTWCLDELQKIIQLKEELNLQVFPIFYGVDPSNVRKQEGSFAEAFVRHEKAQDKMRVQGWRNVLKKVANISGWDSKNWHETKLIDTVVEEVWSKLYLALPFDLEILVGIESKLVELDSLISNEIGGVQFVGIWGTGGLGKTTLARAFYERKQNNFKVHCFLRNVREASKTDGSISLQRKLLSSLDKGSYMDVSDCYDGRKLIRNLLRNRKVLLVLDDVSEISQLENLAGKQGWFGEGSIIIITTRDKHVLSSYDVSTQYDMEFLSDDESLELFHQNAFKGNKPNEDFLELSRTVIEYAKGLPLVLKVLGSFLCGRNILEWKDAIAKFRKVLHNDVLNILQVSFDGLDDEEKTIFLDIACFFNGKQKDYVIQMLQNLDLHPIIGIKVLMDKSLVIDSEKILWVHDILQEMGKNIVIQESPNVGKRSRIWSLEDANSVLEGNEGTEAIRGIGLTLDQECVSYWDPQAFSKIGNLKLLIITSHSHDPHCFLQLHYRLDCFPSALKVLQWNGFYLDDLPSHVSHEELIDLKMKPSSSKQICQGSQAFRRLKFMGLSYSRYLIKTPNFDEIPNLQNLLLEGCINLVELHPSLAHHQNLLTVNLKGCKSLKALPSKFEMKCLETLVLSGCLQIRRLPEFGKIMKCLSILDVEETSITKLPESLVNLRQLIVLNVSNCKNLVCLPNVIHCLKFIRNLNISGCPKLSRLPENLNENVALEVLDASGTAISEVPSSILHLKNLRSLSFSRCSGQAQSSSRNFSSFWTRFFRLTRPSISTGLLLPPSLSCLTNLRELDLSYCNLSNESIPNDINALSNLEILDLSYCNLSDESLPNDINALSSLRGLDLSGNNFVNLPVGFFSNLLKLWRLYFNNCPRLQLLPQLPPTLYQTQAIDCPSMKYIWDFQQLLLNVFKVFEYQEGFYSTVREFCMRIGGSEVPSWFHNQNCFCDDDAWDHRQPNVSFITNIHDHHYSSKWLGVAVCLLIEGHYGASAPDGSSQIRWLQREVGSEILRCVCAEQIIESRNDHSQLYLFFFRNSEKKSLQFSFCIHNCGEEAKFEIRKCGWRVLYTEDIEAWRRIRCEGCSSSNNDSDNYNSLDELGATKATSDCSSNSQFINGNEEEDGQSKLDVDIQIPLIKRRKLG